MIRAEEIAERLHLPAPSAASEIREWLSLLEDDYKAFDARLEALPPERAYPLTLDVYTHEAVKTYQRYREKELPDEVFWDGAKTLPIWREACLKETGIDGIKLRLWPYRFLNLEVFRLGRLEYQESRLKDEVRVAHQRYAKGSPCLEVHIPAGKDLDLSEVHYSLASAPYFYRKYFGKNYELFHCASWLLSPALIGLLPEDSNILRFQQNFTLYGEDFSSRQAEERVFGFVSDDPEDYPEETSLQKNMKAYLKDGGRMSLGLGILPLLMPEDEDMPPFRPGESFSCGCCGCGT